MNLNKLHQKARRKFSIITISILISWLFIAFNAFNFSSNMLETISSNYVESFKILPYNLKNMLVSLYENKNNFKIAEAFEPSLFLEINKEGLIESTNPVTYLNKMNINESPLFQEIKKIKNYAFFRTKSLADGKNKLIFACVHDNKYLVLEMDKNIFMEKKNISMIIVDSQDNYLIKPDFIMQNKIDAKKYPLFSINLENIFLNNIKNVDNYYIITSFDIRNGVFFIFFLLLLAIFFIVYYRISDKKEINSINDFESELINLTDSFTIFQKKLILLESSEPEKLIELNFNDVIKALDRNMEFEESIHLKELLMLSISNLSKHMEEISATYEEMASSNEELESLYSQLEETYKRLEDSYKNFSSRLSKIAEKYDDITGRHIDRVPEYCKFIAEKMMLDKTIINDIYYYSNLHDIGKLFVKREVLDKPGKLTEEEYTEMQKHTVFGAEMLEGDDKFKIAKNIARHHHERYDGNGYPEQLKGESIPVEARIVSLADVYDALRSKRPYKEGFSHEKACEIILKGDERTQSSAFDPKILQIFKIYNMEFKRIFDENQ